MYLGSVALGQRLNQCAEAVFAGSIAAGRFHPKPLHDRRYFPLRLPDTYATFQPAHCDVLIVKAVANLVRRDVEWSPKLEVCTGVAVLRRHDTDDFKRLAIKLNLPSKNFRVAGESALPKTMAENGDSRIMPLLFFCENAAH